ncbi:hypothetical protein ACNOYE_30865 [Nannocystaceae bacterium ST9]
MPNASDRRRALDALDTQLRTTVLDVVKAAWTSALSGAAKSVTDVWPDKLSAAATSLQMAFANYRPLVEQPATPRDTALAGVLASANAYASDLGSTSNALVGAKNFKSESDKLTIDAARDSIDRAAIALTGWVGDFQSFEASVGASPNPSPSPKPNPNPNPTSTIETYATIANGNPYGMALRATISSTGDWSSPTNRPDQAFADVKLGEFGQVRARLDLAANASSAKFRIEATMLIDPPVTLAFTCDQAVAKGPAIDYQPIAIEGTNAQFVVFQSTQTNARGQAELAVVVAEQKGI